MGFTPTLGGQIGGFVYGAIIVLAMLVAFETPPPPPPIEIAIGLIATVIVVALAHGHAQSIARDYDSGARISWSEAARQVLANWPLAAAALPPGLLFAAAGWEWLSLESAFTVSYVMLLAGLFAVSYRSRRRAGGRLGPALLDGTIDLFFGLLIVALKGLLH